MEHEPFLPAAVAGTVPGDAILECIDRWHDAGGLGVELHDYLGMTVDEYTLWVERPQALEFIIESRRSAVPIHAVVSAASALESPELQRRFDATPEELAALAAWLDS